MNNSESIKTPKPSWLRKLITITILIIVSAALVFGLRSCMISSRTSNTMNAPVVTLATGASEREGIPVYGDTVRFNLTFPKGHTSEDLVFVEVVSDDVYQNNTSNAWAAIFSTRLFGGRTYPPLPYPLTRAALSGGLKETFSIPYADLRKPVDTRYWIRAGQIHFESKLDSATEKPDDLDRLLAVLVEVPVDSAFGLMSFRYSNPHGVESYIKAELGEFRPFWILSSPGK